MSRYHHKYATLGTTFMSTNGDGTGLVNQAVNGSVTPVDFKVSAGEGDNFEIHTATVVITGATNFHADRYGDLIGLSNGVQILTNRPTRSTPLRDITALVPIRNNSQWIVYVPDVELHTFSGSGNTVLTCSFNFDEAGLPLRLGSGEEFIVRIRDDLSGLVSQYIRVGLTRAPRTSTL